MGMIHLTGRVICKDDTEAAIVRDHLAEHIRLTRAEPGCLFFDATATADPLCWQVEERFADRAAFEAHQTRTRASVWFRVSSHITRDFTIRED